MSEVTPDSLFRLDSALISLRRYTEASPTTQKIEHDGEPMDMSTILVVDAIARYGTTPCSVADLASALNVAQSTMSRLVDRAATAGMVARTIWPSDNRRVRVTLTSSGGRLQKQAIAFRTQHLSNVLASWSDREVLDFARLMTRFSASVRSLADHSDPR
jgi:DNA-binding MarR family transcriptional regulator